MHFKIPKTNLHFIFRKQIAESSAPNVRDTGSVATAMTRVSECSSGPLTPPTTGSSASNGWMVNQSAKKDSRRPSGQRKTSDRAFMYNPYLELPRKVDELAKDGNPTSLEPQNCDNKCDASAQLPGQIGTNNDTNGTTFSQHRTNTSEEIIESCSSLENAQESNHNSTSIPNSQSSKNMSNTFQSKLTKIDPKSPETPIRRNGTCKNASKTLDEEFELCRSVSKVSALEEAQQQSSSICSGGSFERTGIKSLGNKFGAKKKLQNGASRTKSDQSLRPIGPNIRPIYPSLPFSPYQSPSSSPKLSRLFAQLAPCRESRRVSIETFQDFILLNQYRLTDNIGQVSYMKMYLFIFEKSVFSFMAMCLSSDKFAYFRLFP